MKRILVTGCSGLVGTHVVEKLLEKNYSVLGIDISEMKKQINDNRFHFGKCDFIPNKVSQIPPAGILYGIAFALPGFIICLSYGYIWFYVRNHNKYLRNCASR